MMDKREMTEKALGRFLMSTLSDELHYWRFDLEATINALAENKDVIMIECEVGHKRLEHPHKPFYDKDVTHIRGGEKNDWHLVYNRTLGKPGKYFFIGLPLEEEGK